MTHEQCTTLYPIISQRVVQSEASRNVNFCFGRDVLLRPWGSANSISKREIQSHDLFFTCARIFLPTAPDELQRQRMMELTLTTLFYSTALIIGRIFRHSALPKKTYDWKIPSICYQIGYGHRYKADALMAASLHLTAP